MSHSPPFDLSQLSDDALLCRLAELLRRSRCVEAELVAHIGEVDARRLYRREAAPSMFAYCPDVLHLSEHEAYLRITVARAARDHPVLLTMLGEGRLHLSPAEGRVHLTPHPGGRPARRLPPRRGTLPLRRRQRSALSGPRTVGVPPRPPVGARGRQAVDNVRLMCRAHNALLAEHDYGAPRMARYRKEVQSGESSRPPP